MSEDILAQLDALEKQDDGTLRAIDLLRTFASSPERMMLLIERYAASDSSLFVACVAGCLNAKAVAEPGVFENSGLLVTAFFRKLRLRDAPEIRITLLNAIHAFPPGLPEVERETLRDMLWECLTDRSRLAALVHSEAVETLDFLLQSSLLDSLFPASERSELIPILESISQETWADELSHTELMRVFQHLKTESR
jgi:hypothetical protein